MHIKYIPINMLEVSIFNSKVDTFIMEKEKETISSPTI